MKLYKFLAVVVIAGGAAACGDLEVVNLNDPDRVRAISQPGDVEALISGSFSSWWSSGHYSRAGIMQSGMADYWSSSWGNFAMRDMSSEPRIGWNNDPAYGNASNLRNTWRDIYRALSGVRDGILAIEGGVDLGEPLGSDNNRGLAFGAFVQGLALSRLATTFDQGFIIDEATSLDDPNALPQLVPFTELYAEALVKFDKAISLSGSGSFTVPSDWLGFGPSMSNTELGQLVHSFKARLMIEIARNPSERAAVNWNAVMSEVSAGITEDFGLEHDGVNWAWSRLHNRSGANEGWGRSDYRWIGPADQSGRYQDWANITNVELRTPFYIDTDDRRITAGDETSDGLYQKFYAGNSMRAERGTYHYSNYIDSRYRPHRLNNDIGTHVAMNVAEMDFIMAEGLFRTGNKQGAVDLINKYRVPNGELPAVTLEGDQTARCVPRHATTGACTDLWTALMWDKRMEVYHSGAGSDFFDARGWGILVKDTPLQWPVPGSELDLLLMEIYSFGGPGGASAAPNTSRGAIDPETIRWKREALEAYDAVVQAEGKAGAVIH